jgi:hypothetical protein
MLWPFKYLEIINSPILEVSLRLLRNYKYFIAGKNSLFLFRKLMLLLVSLRLDRLFFLKVALIR